MKPYSATLVHELALFYPENRSHNIAVAAGSEQSGYQELARDTEKLAQGLANLNLKRSDRVAIYLPKTLPCVLAFLATSRAAGVFVPINPVLKPQQVAHILQDSEARILITSSSRLKALAPILSNSQNLETIILTDGSDAQEQIPLKQQSHFWESLPSATSHELPRTIDSDMAAILYTSGSTGKPKGVVLSHRNIVVGAKSVAGYLGNSPDDRILSLLPLSFDAGLSQLTTAFYAGAKLILLDYLLPGDVAKVCEREKVTGITGVPPLWMQIADRAWPETARENLRYFANTGGKMPGPLLKKLRSLFSNAKPYLMYGLTEAFRSTYLEPSEVDKRPDSIGKAIPDAEILVINSEGRQCEPDEPGELVHRGPLVSLGYWKDKAKTAERFRAAPGQPSGLPMPEIAVWSGDTVVADSDGFLYFVGRKDDMIKTSGYRVSPTEVEEMAFSSGLITEAAALGVPHPKLGQGIVLVVSNSSSDTVCENLNSFLRQNLPGYMVPLHIEQMDQLPKNQNGKIDRNLLKESFIHQFEGTET